MAESWTISVGGRVYGPYSLAQMQGFHGEGRLADHSMVARSDEEQFHPAREDAELAPLFKAAAIPAETKTVHRPAAGHAVLSHFVIMAEMKSRSISGLEEEIFSLGTAQRFMSQAWILTSDSPINTVRNALVKKMGKLDTLFIVDAAHDKAAWFNFARENDERVRSMWQRSPEVQAKRA